MDTESDAECGINLDESKCKSSGRSMSEVSDSAAPVTTELQATGSSNTDADSELGNKELPVNLDEAQYVTRRKQLKRRFTSVRKSLDDEFSRRVPSNRYLAKLLGEAEALVNAIEQVVNAQRTLLETLQDDDRLGVLQNWQEQFSVECKLLARVSAHLESNERSSKPSRSSTVSVHSHASSRASSTHTANTLSPVLVADDSNTGMLVHETGNESEKFRSIANSPGSDVFQSPAQLCDLAQLGDKASSSIGQYPGSHAPSTTGHVISSSTSEGTSVQGITDADDIDVVPHQTSPSLVHVQSLLPSHVQGDTHDSPLSLIDQGTFLNDGNQAVMSGHSQSNVYTSIAAMPESVHSVGSAVSVSGALNAHVTDSAGTSISPANPNLASLVPSQLSQSQHPTQGLNPNASAFQPVAQPTLPPSNVGQGYLPTLQQGFQPVAPPTLPPSNAGREHLPTLQQFQPSGFQQRGCLPQQRGCLPQQRGCLPQQRGCLPQQRGCLPQQRRTTVSSAFSQPLSQLTDQPHMQSSTKPRVVFSSRLSDCMDSVPVSSQQQIPSGSQWTPTEIPGYGSHCEQFSSQPGPFNMYGGSSGFMGSWVKPLQLPKFSGKDKDYLEWRQRFMIAIGNDPNLNECYKLARLKEALDGGTAASLIKGIMDGPGAYRRALEELESWFGGMERHLEKQMREVINQPKIHNERDLDGLQKYAVALRNTLSNMATSGLTPGHELYLLATEKVPRTMLIKYFERYGENAADVSVFASWLVERLRTMKRAEDRVLTAERVQSQQKTRQSTGGDSTGKGKPSRTLVSVDTTTPSASSKNASRCLKCRGDHLLPQCEKFGALTVQKRWD